MGKSKLDVEQAQKQVEQLESQISLNNQQINIQRERKKQYSEYKVRATYWESLLVALAVFALFYFYYSTQGFYGMNPFKQCPFLDNVLATYGGNFWITYGGLCGIVCALALILWLPVLGVKQIIMIDKKMDAKKQVRLCEGRIKTLDIENSNLDTKKWKILQDTAKDGNNWSIGYIIGEARLEINSSNYSRAKTILTPLKNAGNSDAIRLYNKADDLQNPPSYSYSGCYTGEYSYSSSGSGRDWSRDDDLDALNEAMVRNDIKNGGDGVWSRDV